MKEFFGKITSKDIRNIIAVIFVIGCFIMVYLFLIRQMPLSNKDVLLMSSGYLFGALQLVLSYYFGSSKNEADKAKKEAE